MVKFLGVANKAHENVMYTDRPRVRKGESGQKANRVNFLNFVLTTKQDVLKEVLLSRGNY